MDVHELFEQYLVVLVDHVLPLILLQVVNETLVIIQLVAVLNCQFGLMPRAPSRDLLQPLLVPVQVSNMEINSNRRVLLHEFLRYNV